MTTSVTPARLRPQLRELKLFALSPEGRPALLGALGAALIAAGGLGAGSTRVNDPVLESMHLSWLRFGHGLVLSSILLWAGVALMLLAWLWLGRRVVDRSATEYTMVVTTGFWLLPLLLSWGLLLPQRERRRLLRPRLRCRPVWQTALFFLQAAALVGQAVAFVQAAA